MLRLLRDDVLMSCASVWFFPVDMNRQRRNQFLASIQHSTAGRIQDKLTNMENMQPKNHVCENLLFLRRHYSAVHDDGRKTRISKLKSDKIVMPLSVRGYYYFFLSIS